MCDFYKCNLIKELQMSGICNNPTDENQLALQPCS